MIVAGGSFRDGNFFFFFFFQACYSRLCGGALIVDIGTLFLFLFFSLVLFC